MTPATSTVNRGFLLGTNEVLVADSVVTPEEQAALLAWTEAQYRSGKLLDTQADGGVYSSPFHSDKKGLTRLTRAADGGEADGQQELVWVPEVASGNVDPLPGEFWSVRDRVVNLLGLDGLEEDEYKGSFVSYIAPGAGIHAHRDGRLRIDGEDLLILRCNVLFRKPCEGGLPVVQFREFDIPDRGMWAFFPTEQIHSATPVGGSQFRGLASFGFLVRYADLWERRFHVAAGFEAEFGLDTGAAAKNAMLHQLRSEQDGARISKDRVDLLEFILNAAEDFSVREAAGHLERPPADVGEALRTLQRSGVIESNSSRRGERGKVTVL